jgi:hypothetical protein
MPRTAMPATAPVGALVPGAKVTNSAAPAAAPAY